MYIYQEKLLKWRILSFPILTKFAQNPCTIAHGLWPDFGATSKIQILIRISSNFIHNIRTCIYIRKRLLKWRILSFPILMKFAQNPCTIAHGLWPDFGATSKIHKKSNLNQNQLKLYT